MQNTPCSGQMLANFLVWMNKNYVWAGPDPDQYITTEDAKKLEKNIKTYSILECVEHYERIQIPPLPTASNTESPKSLEVAQKATHNLQVTMDALKKITALVPTAPPSIKGQLSSIITKAMDQII